MPYRSCKHQSIHHISVEGKRPDGTEWYQCNNKKCGARLLLETVVLIPRSVDVMESEYKDAELSGVRIVSQAVAEDGSRWNTVQQAKKRNSLLKEVAELEKFLLPRTPELERGDGYIQQNKEAVDEFRIRFYDLARTTFGKEHEPIGDVDRFLNTKLEDDHPLYVLNQRFDCIDRNHREWQSVFLAQHPDEGKQVRLNNEPKPPTTSSEEGPHEQRESG